LKRIGIASVGTRRALRCNGLSCGTRHFRCNRGYYSSFGSFFSFFKILLFKGQKGPKGHKALPVVCVFTNHNLLK
jgi:hypothetical protein